MKSLFTQKGILLTPNAHLETLTYEGCSQMSWPAGLSGTGEAESASWRPEEVANRGQLNIPSAQDVTY